MRSSRSTSPTASSMAARVFTPGVTSALSRPSRRLVSGVLSWCEASAVKARSCDKSSPRRAAASLKALAARSSSQIPGGVKTTVKSPSPRRMTPAASSSMGVARRLDCRHASSAATPTATKASATMASQVARTRLATTAQGTAARAAPATRSLPWIGTPTASHPPDRVSLTRPASAPATSLPPRSGPAPTARWPVVS